MLKFFSALLAKLASLACGLNPVRMQLTDGEHHLVSSFEEFEILLNFWDRLFLLGISGLCIKLVQRLQGNSRRYPISRLNLNRDGFRLFSQVHRHQQPRCANVLNAHNSRVISIALSDNHHLMLTSSFDGTTKLWNRLTQSCIGILQNSENSGSYVAFHPHKSLFVRTDDGAVEFIEFSNDGQGGIKLSRKARLLGPKGAIIDMCIHPKYPQFMATASVDGSAGLWCIDDDNSAARLRRLPHDSTVLCVAFHPEKLLLASGSRDFTVKIWVFTIDLSPVTCVSQITHTGWVRAIDFHPTIPVLVTGCEASVHLWDISSELPNPICLKTLGGHEGTVNSVKFHPDTPNLLVTSDWVVWGGTVRYFLLSLDARYAKLVGEYLHSSSPVFRLVFDKAGFLVIACEKQVLSLQ
jgi:WD40 repeat protein